MIVAVVVEGLSLALGSLPRSIPGLHLAHGIVAPLIAAVVLAWPGGTSGPMSTTPVPALWRPDAPLTVATLPATSGQSATAAPSAVGTTVDHTVQRRDTLWDLAERYLGDGYRAGELFELNQGRPQPDGRTLTDPSVIRPGWVSRCGPPISSSARAALIRGPPLDKIAVITNIAPNNNMGGSEGWRIGRSATVTSRPVAESRYE